MYECEAKNNFTNLNTHFPTKSHQIKTKTGYIAIIVDMKHKTIDMDRELKVFTLQFVKTNSS